MKCAKCPLYIESHEGEICALFGPCWDNDLQYEDKDGNTIGCYIDPHYIIKFNKECEDYWYLCNRVSEEQILESHERNLEDV